MEELGGGGRKVGELGEDASPLLPSPPPPPPPPVGMTSMLSAHCPSGSVPELYTQCELDCIQIHTHLSSHRTVLQGHLQCHTCAHIPHTLHTNGEYYDHCQTRTHACVHNMRGAICWQLKNVLCTHCFSTCPSESRFKLTLSTIYASVVLNKSV